MWQNDCINKQTLVLRWWIHLYCTLPNIDPYPNCNYRIHWSYFLLRTYSLNSRERPRRNQNRGEEEGYKWSPSVPPLIDSSSLTSSSCKSEMKYSLFPYHIISFNISHYHLVHSPCNAAISSHRNQRKIHVRILINVINGEWIDGDTFFCMIQLYFFLLSLHSIQLLPINLLLNTSKTSRHLNKKSLQWQIDNDYGIQLTIVNSFLLWSSHCIPKRSLRGNESL